jgi:hypothetical protein
MRARLAVATALQSPLFWILALAFALRVVGIGWGLPASDGWDNDGIAPRDFLAGLVQTFTPGRFFTYPPVHLLVLVVLTSPVTIIALANAHSLAPTDVIHEIIKVPYMTVIAYAARSVTVCLSIGIVYAIAKMAEEIRGPRAGWCVAAVCTVNAPFTYYAKTSNLDVPYLFWSCLALLALVRAIARREPRRLRAMALWAALALGTKDQAYAVFAVCVPASCALWFLVDPWTRANARCILREFGFAAMVLAGVVPVVDAIVFNPTGFRARLAFLVGPASQDFVNYTNDWTGRVLVIRDSVAIFDRFYPWAFAGFLLFGVGLVARRAGQTEKAKLAATLVPAMGALSFTVAFNWVARRTELRFLLPQTLLVAVYAGIAVETLIFELRATVARRVARGAVGIAFAAAMFGCANVDANLMLDPRYDCEAWLGAHVAAGDTIEVYGLNVYLPRFPRGANVTRVGPDPIDRRNPLPGVVEVEDAYGRANERRAHYLIVSDGWVWRYRLAPDPSDNPLEPGRAYAPTHWANAADRDAVAYFRSLFVGTRGYRVAHTSFLSSRLWSPIDYHASTSRTVWIFERQD